MAPADTIAGRAADTGAANRTDDRRIVMVTGAYPPDVCGVGDYVDRLMLAARSWQLFVERDWSAGAAPGIVRRLLRRRPTDVVIQYPTQGYGWSLVPHLLVAIGAITRRYRSILALHEFTSLSRKARFALALTSHFAGHIVFTTEAECQRARTHPLFSSWVATSVIGILSNIPSTANPPAFSERAIDLAYFGHIRPNKGLEDFLEVMAALRQASERLRIAIIGKVPAGFESFGERVAERGRGIDCELMPRLDDQAVGRVLGDVKILYLPFRDGVSARRGSVLAGLSNGALVATRIGDATPDAMLPAVIACSGTVQDVPVLLKAVSFADDHASVLRHAGLRYIATVLPRDWAHVAALYERAIAADRSSRTMPAC